MSKKTNIQNNSSSKQKLIFKISLFVLVCSVFLNAYLMSTNNSLKTELKEDISLTYPFLSKRIFAQSQNDLILNFVPLRKALKEYVASQNNELGVYFEYLPSGISIGVNDRTEVKLASLSKVPLAMSVYKKVEQGKMSLVDIITITEEDIDKKFGTLWKAGAGSQFTVKELIDRSLIESDNTAYHALLRQLSNSEVADVYENLEIEVLSKETSPLVSPKSYSSIFKCLFLSSYLSEESSHEILSILTRTIFTDKIPSGIDDKSVKISHKIGVFSRFDSKESLFTDCGIIYAQERPYILCIFSSKPDEVAREQMKYISNMVYSYVTIVKGGNN